MIVRLRVSREEYEQRRAAADQAQREFARLLQEVVGPARRARRPLTEGEQAAVAAARERADQAWQRVWEARQPSSRHVSEADRQELAEARAEYLKLFHELEKPALFSGKVLTPEEQARLDASRARCRAAEGRLSRH